MKLLTFRTDNRTRLGLLTKDRVIDLANANTHLFNEPAPSDMLTFLDQGETTMTKARRLLNAAQKNWKTLQQTPNTTYNIGDVQILAPIPHPRKNIICLGLNYSDHSKEFGQPVPQYPIFFTKPPTSIIGPDEPILYPKNTREVDFEAELAFIFGKRGKNVSEEDAYDYIAGYTVFNDVTVRNFQRNHDQWFKGKSLDTFAPMGPYLITKDEISDPHNLNFSLELNGTVMQKSNTSNMIFKIPTLVKYIAMDMTVEPGDIVATGTPSGVGYRRNPPIFLKPGDIVKISVEKVGVLQNRVVSQ